MNDIVIYEDHCELILRKRDKSVALAEFDKEDYELVSPLLWNLHQSGAPRNHLNRIYLHQLVMGKKKGFEIDHINGDRLDNRKQNLRFVTHHQNMWNLPLSRRNKSGCRGVWFDQKNDAWQVKICYFRKQIFLGRYKDLNEAIRVRKEAEKRLYGQYTRS